MNARLGIWVGAFVAVAIAVTLTIALVNRNNAAASANDEVVTARCGELQPVYEPFEDCIDDQVVTHEVLEGLADIEVRRSRGTIERPDYSGGAYVLDSFYCSRNAWSFEVHQDGKYPDGTRVKVYVADCDPNHVDATPTPGPQ